MDYRTVNLTPDNHQRLKAYKVGGRSFNDVIGDFMDMIDPMEMYQSFLEEHNRRLERMKRGDYVTLDELKAELEDE
jgi:hypothetical protein